MSDQAARGALLTDKVAVVTGGAQGIGGGISRAMAAAGARLLLVDNDVEAATSCAGDIRAAGGSVEVHVGDVRSAPVVAEIAARAAELASGRIDILVNNVGDFRPATRDFLHSDEAQWQAMYEINLLHVLRLTHAILPTMVEQGSGAIVNLSTVEAFRGIPGHTVYSAFNAGVSAFTKSLAVEVGKHGVRVNAIAPDLTDTPQTSAEAMLRGRDPAMTASWLPLGRFGTPEDFGSVAVFLASDQAGFITGHTLPVDGGTLSAAGWYGRSDGKGWRNLPNQV